MQIERDFEKDRTRPGPVEDQCTRILTVQSQELHKNHNETKETSLDEDVCHWI